MTYLLGFDPGRDKCGVAIVEYCTTKSGEEKQRICQHQIFLASEVIAGLQKICQQFPISKVVMGDGTTAKEWQQKINAIALWKRAIATGRCFHPKACKSSYLKVYGR